jgi:outer membrane protein assembly factor BamB
LSARSVIAAVIIVALIYLVLHWRLAARPVPALVGLPVQSILTGDHGALAITAYGTVWPLDVNLTPGMALPHFDMPLLDDPARGNGLALGGSDSGTLMARDLDNGNAGAWDRSFDAPITAPPAVSGNVAVVPLGPGSLMGVDARTGSTLWTLPLGSAVRMRPLHWGKLWVAVDRDERLWFIAETGQAISYLDLGEHVAAMDCDGQWLWAAFSDGRIAAWSAPEHGTIVQMEPGLGRLKAGDGLAVVGSGEGKLIGLQAGAGVPQVLWRRRVEGPVTALAGPVRNGDKDLWIVGTSAAMVYLIDAKTGKRVQAVRIGGCPVTCADAIAGKVVAGGSEGAWQWPLPR